VDTGGRAAAYRGPDRRALRARSAGLPISPSVAAVLLLGALWFVLARYAPQSAADADGLVDRLGRIDVAASALAILAGAAHAVRWKIDGYAPSWWIGWGLVVAGLPGIASGSASEAAASFRFGCAAVTGIAFLRALRSTPVDTAIAPVRSVLTGFALVVAMSVTASSLADVLHGDGVVHLVLGAFLVVVTAASAWQWRRRPDEPFGPVLPLAAGLAISEVVAAAIDHDNPLHTSGAALVRLAAMSLPVVGAVGDLMAAAALQRHAAYREHLGRAVAEHRQRAAEERFAETLHEVRSTVVALEGGVRRLTPSDEGQQSAHLARALAAEIDRLRTLVSSDARSEVTSYLVRDALEPMLTVSRSGGWPVSWDLPDDVAVRGHAADLAQIVHGLLTNATRYAPGTPIDVTASVDGSFVTIRVEDRGPGVARGERELIFERGGRGAARHPETGEGLGLYIARNLARAQGGDLWVEQRSGGGARFVVALPTAEQQAAPGPVPSRASLAVVGPVDEHAEPSGHRSKRSASWRVS
jgi:signal transduction histidine kinase